MGNRAEWRWSVVVNEVAFYRFTAETALDASTWAYSTWRIERPEDDVRSMSVIRGHMPVTQRALAE